MRFKHQDKLMFLNVVVAFIFNILPYQRNILVSSGLLMRTICGKLQEGPCSKKPCSPL